MELVSGLVVGFLLGLGVGWLLGAKQGGAAAARPESSDVPSPLPPPATGGPLHSAAVGGTDAPVSAFGNLLTEMLEQSPQTQIAEMRQDLRRKCLFDDAAVERLVALEREQDPSADELVWLRAAIRRWENDNR